MKNQIPHRGRKDRPKMKNQKQLSRLKKLRSNASAADIREIWDYRSCGLTSDQARQYIKNYSHPNYRHRQKKKIRGQKIGDGGSILARARALREAREKYEHIINNVPELRAAEKLTYNDNTRLLRVDMPDRSIRIIYLIRREDAQWEGKYRPGQYPSHTSTWGEARLLGEARMSNDPHGWQPLNLITTKMIKHDYRGNWINRVVSELCLGGVAVLAPEKIKSSLSTPTNHGEIIFKAVKKIGPGHFSSIFNGSLWVIGHTRHERVSPGHVGGLYGYPTIEQARKIADNPTNINEDVVLPTTILRCVAQGEKIKYDNKIAVEFLTPMEEIER